MGNLSKPFGKVTIPLLVLLTISFSASPAYAKYGGGTGEPNDPYLIFDANQMNAIGADSNDWDKHFLLMADIDLAGFTGISFNIIGNWDNPFTGRFDGSDHTISNFTYTSTGTSRIGLFGYVDGENAEIKNLGLIDPEVDAGTGDQVGLLVGRLQYGTISNCYVEGGSVTGHWYVGGLVGYNWGTISDCYSKGSISGAAYTGGVVGRHYKGTVSCCYFEGIVSGGGSYSGGIAGINWSWGTISNCYSSGSVYGPAHVGGLAGGNFRGSRSEGIITNCYSTSNVEGNKAVGGLVGLNKSVVLNSYSTGIVSGVESV
ncbi:MAG: GLUG motif-containing protein, partial [Planctomycetota bacterium]